MVTGPSFRPISPRREPSPPRSSTPPNYDTISCDELHQRIVETKAKIKEQQTDIAKMEESMIGRDN